MNNRLTTGKIYRRKNKKEMTYEEALQLIIQLRKIQRRGLAKKLCHRNTRKYMDSLAVGAAMTKIYHEDKGVKEPEWFKKAIAELNIDDSIRKKIIKKVISKFL
jgi:hypothetical protein